MKKIDRNIQSEEFEPEQEFAHAGLWLPKGLKKKLRILAAQNDLSFNKQVTSILEQSIETDSDST